MPGGAPVDVPLFFTDDETIYFSSPVEVKLLLLSGRMGAPAGHSLLFAVGAGPPHDGVRKARRLNLSHDLAGVPLAGSGLSTRSPRPSSPQERSGVPSWGCCWFSLPVQAAARAAAGFRPKRNSVSCVCRFVERRACEFVPAAADSTGDVGLARLIARRGEAEMRTNIP